MPCGLPNKVSDAHITVQQKCSRADRFGRRWVSLAMNHTLQCFVDSVGVATVHGDRVCFWASHRSGLAQNLLRGQ